MSTSSILRRGGHWLLGAALLPCAASAQDVVFTHVAGDFNMAIDVQSAPGDPALYVAELSGTIKVVLDGSVLPTPLLDIQDRVVMAGEMGLLGFVFDPLWPASPYLYVHYGREGQGAAAYQNVVARYTADPATRTASAASEVVVYVADAPNGWHNAGALDFGPDGLLYIGVGDSGVGTEAQSTSAVLGSVIRLDVRGTGTPTDCEAAAGIGTAAAGNPLADGPGGACDEMFAYGFRNPWRLSVDAIDGTVWVGDVGDFSFEEVNIVAPGANYGWPIMEGAQCHPQSPGCNQAGLSLPAWAYPRAPGQAVIGGYVYRGSAIPSLSGRYVFGDLQTGDIWRLQDDGSGYVAIELGTSPGGSVSSFGLDSSGRLLVLSLVGPLFRIDPATTAVDDAPSANGLSITLEGANPVVGRVSLELRASAATSVRVELLDALGRRVAVLHEGAVQPGSTPISYDASNLVPGVYVARAESDRGEASVVLARAR